MFAWVDSEFYIVMYSSQSLCHLTAQDDRNEYSRLYNITVAEIL